MIDRHSVTAALYYLLFICYYLIFTIIVRCSENFKQSVKVVHRQPITSPLHVVRGFEGQTVTLILPAADTVGTFCFLVGSVARSKRFVDDLNGFFAFKFTSDAHIHTRSLSLSLSLSLSYVNLMTMKLYAYSKIN